jgi:aspartate racemase
MKTVGAVGGIGPESTIDYYRSLIAKYRARTGDGGNPTLLINSIDMTKMLGFVEAGDRAALTGYLAAEVARLARISPSGESRVKQERSST